MPEISQNTETDQSAIALVASAIEDNKLEVTSADLEAKANSKGEGTIVYVSQTRFSGVERNVVWMVIDSKAFALNSPSKMVTPSLPWPREADEKLWSKTKIDKFSGASEVIEMVY